MPNAVVVVSSLFISIGGFLFGYELGIVSSTLSQPFFIAHFSNPSDSVTGAIVACYTGGAIIGTLIVPYMNDGVGRKWTLFAGAAVGTFGCALQAGATTIGMLIAGRIIAGLSIGQLTSTIPLYCSEIAPAKHRGALSGLLQWMLSWGFLVAQWLGYGCTFVNSPFQWRFPLAFQCIPAAILCGGVFFLPESPRFLVEKNRDEEARKILQSLHGDGSNEEFLALEFREIKDAIIADQMANRTSWKAFVVNPSSRRRLLLGCGVQFFCQVSGLNVINYYGPRIYQALNIGTQQSLLIIGISGSLALIYTTVALALIDRVGRIKPLIVGALGCGFAMLVNAVLSDYFPADSGNHNALRAQVAMNFIIQFFFVPLGVISWVYPAEIFPTEVRAKGNALATLVNWSTNLLFAQVSPIALGQIGFRYFYVFFAFNMVSATCFFFFYPETKGYTLEQLNQLFGDEVIPHALEDPSGAAVVIEAKDATIEHMASVNRV